MYVRNNLEVLRLCFFLYIDVMRRHSTREETWRNLLIVDSFVKGD